MSLCCNVNYSSESHISRFAVLLGGRVRVRVRVWSREQRKIKDQRHYYAFDGEDLSLRMN